MTPKPTEAEILERLCVLVGEQVNIDASSVTPDSDFFTDLNFDSLDAVEYTMKVEEEFDISITDEQAQSIRTPRQAFETLAAVLAPNRVS